MKTIKMKTVLSLCLMAMTAMPLHAVDYNIPGIGTDSRVGASMPYTRYESTDAVLGGGATLKTSTDYDSRNIATQASERSYIALPSNGSYAEWTAVRGGNGVTMRFTLPDAESGTDGRRGSLDIYINNVKRDVRVYGTKKDRIELSSYWAWQYYDSGHTDNASDEYIEGAIPCFAFDEVGFIVEGGITKGDKIRIQSRGENGLEYGVDFLEVEKTDPVERPYNSISAADYGNDVVRAANEAVNKGMTLYIPEGNYDLGSKWYLPGGVKIVGAGIYYTNIHFTRSDAGGGGIVCSGGSEISNFHLSTNLHSRHNQGANYKGLEGGPNVFYAHDLWIQHFECGAWFELGNNIRVINCRLRDNIADGLNFCRATSNSTVYNCSVRNNGDDGLAMWNHSWQCGDEENNRFCYNTVELDWRAGSIGVFGGNGHRIYNNYICDGVLSAGIRVNTDFPGYGFQSTQDIWFDNNYVVNCGTQKDIFGGMLAGVEVRSSNKNGAGDVRNVHFNNTQIYNSQSQDILLTGNVNGITIPNNKQATVPGFPDVDDNEPASKGVLEGVKDYDLIVEGLAWKNQNGSADLKKGDKVTFTVKIKNNSDVNIPAGVIIGAGICIEEYEGTGTTNIINNSYNGGLDAWTSINLQIEWTATAGGHVATVTVDPYNKLPDETDENNNSRTKKFNVTADDNNSNNKNFTPVTGGCDLYVTDVTYKNNSRNDGTIQPGDEILFTAVAVNAGDKATPSNTKHGVKFKIDGKDYNEAHTPWCDDFNGPMASHEFEKMAANGGGSQSDGRKDLKCWVATEGTHTVTAWIDDGNLIEEVNEYNNETTITLPTIPYNGIKYIENPDQPDNLDGAAEPEPTSATIKIGSTGYATYCHTRDLDFTGIDGLKAYIASGVKKQEGNDVVTLLIVEVNKVPAYTGILLKGTPNTEFEIPFCSTTDLYSNLLVGVTTDTYINAEANGKKNFLLANGANGVGFYPAKAGTLGANKAYLPLPSSMVQQANAIVFYPDETTDIDGVTTGKDIDENGVFYTLTGIRVTHPQKGIYIHNGKKIVVR